VSRLTTWRTLERAEPTDAELKGFQERIDSVAAAQQGESDLTSLPSTSSPSSCT
jgi:hypothetical protein